MRKKNTNINHKIEIKKMQLSFSFDLINLIDVDDEVFMVHNIIEEMNLDYLESAYHNLGRKPLIDCKSMLKILIFAYLNRTYSSRDIQKSCKYDLRYRWILENKKAPSHVTINRFRNKLIPFIEEFFEDFIFFLYKHNQIDFESIYIDGTKIESFANRYSFVWKKSILKFQQNLIDKIIKYFELSEDISEKDIIKLLNKTFKHIKNLCKKEKIKFVYGQGSRKTKEQRQYELYQEWLEKLTRYHNSLEIMGERNSYSKTDTDATFMRMKEDHMMNGQLKPAYNIQCATNGGYIIGVKSFPNPNDQNTLIPFLDELTSSYGKKIKRVVADSGYENEENYVYLKEKNIESYIKPSNYEQKKKSKYKQDISKRENMEYVESEDYYICAKGRKLLYINTFTRKNKTGFKSNIKNYECENCCNCEFIDDCMKYKNKDNIKRINVSENFNKLRSESELNINSLEGKEELVNRSIQAEGAFSYIKSGMEYNRFTRKGHKNIISDLILLSISINIKKYSSKIKSENIEFKRYKIVA